MTPRFLTRAKNISKPVLVALACLCVLPAVFLIGDYHGLWKREPISRLEILQVRFKAIDGETGRPVDGFHIRCRRRAHNHLRAAVAGAATPGSPRARPGIAHDDLCVPAASAAEAPGVKTLRVAASRQFEKGLLFHRDRGLLADATPIELWVLHGDYKTLTLSFTSEQLLSPTPDPKEITLFPRR